MHVHPSPLPPRPNIASINFFKTALRNNKAAFTSNTTGTNGTNGTTTTDVGVGSAISSYRNDYR
jgi:hypothetical protein